MLKKPHVVVLSHVLPGTSSGQERRVANVNRGLHTRFDVTFLTGTSRLPTTTPLSDPVGVDAIRAVPSVNRWPPIAKIHRALGAGFVLAAHGGRLSNYSIPHEVFPIRAVAELVRELHRDNPIDLAVLHYCHTAYAVAPFQALGIPAVLDMHDLLIGSRRELIAASRIPRPVARWLLRRYEKWEEDSWSKYDAVIAISDGEYEHVVNRIDKRVFLAPMGVSLSDWRYQWRTEEPLRIGYYGGLQSARAVTEVMRLYHHVLPSLWRAYPDAEFWILGGEPSTSITALRSDSRVRIPGFVLDIAPILGSLAVVVCPFSGKYGFRSRVIEVMATGAPVVATSDAIHGMGLGRDSLALANSDEEMVDACARILSSPSFAVQLSATARKLVEDRFSFEATYGRLASDLLVWIGGRGPMPSPGERPRRR